LVSTFVALARDKLTPAFALHGEAWAHQPMKPAADRAAAPVVDSSRPAQSLSGAYFEDEGKPLILNAYDPRTDQRPGVASSHPRVEFWPPPNNPVFVLREGDILTRDNGRKYVVGAPRVTKTGIVIGTVNSLGGWI